MSDILMLPERVKNNIQIGEGHYREFKSAYEGEPNNKKPGDVKKLCRYIAEALMAFANADGGELLIGVEDDGTITGVPHKESEIQAMLTACNTLIMGYDRDPLPLIINRQLELEGKIILFFLFLKAPPEFIN